MVRSALEDPQLLDYSSTKLELLLRNVEFVTNNWVCNSRGSIHRLQCEWYPGVMWQVILLLEVSSSSLQFKAKEDANWIPLWGKSRMTAAFLLRNPRQFRKATMRGILWLWPDYCSGQMVWQMLCTSVLSRSACQLVHGILSLPEGTHQTGIMLLPFAWLFAICLPASSRGQNPCLFCSQPAPQAKRTSFSQEAPCSALELPLRSGWAVGREVRLRMGLLQGSHSSSFQVSRSYFNPTLQVGEKPRWAKVSLKLSLLHCPHLLTITMSLQFTAKAQ